MSQETAWEMDASVLVNRFAWICAQAGRPADMLNARKADHAEARYLGGVITGRLLGKGAELPFHRSDKVVLKPENADISSFRPVAELGGSLVVRRVHYEKGGFALEFSGVGTSDEPKLFVANAFMASEDVPVDVANVT